MLILCIRGSLINYDYHLWFLWVNIKFVLLVSLLDLDPGNFSPFFVYSDYDTSGASVDMGKLHADAEDDSLRFLEINAASQGSRMSLAKYAFLFVRE